MRIDRKILLLSLLFIGVCSVEMRGQRMNVDSLLGLLKNAKEDTNKVKLYIELSNAYFDNENILKNAEAALQLSEKLNYNSGIATAIGNIGYVFGQQGLTEKSLEYFMRELEIRKKMGSKTEMGTTLSNIGFTYLNLGQIEKALEYNLLSLKVFEETANELGIASTLVNLGGIYLEFGQTEKAFEFFERALKLNEKNGDKTGVAGTLNSIAGVYYSKGQFEKSMEYILRSLKIREEIGDKEGIANGFNNCGGMYDAQGNTKKALEYYERALKISEEIGSKEVTIISLINLSSLDFAKKNYKQAENYMLRSLKLSKEIGFPEYISRSAQWLHSIYKKTGDHKKALENYELFIRMRDSIVNQETKKASMKSQFKYAYEKKAAQDSVAHAKESEVKNIELEKQKAEIKAKHNQQYALYGGLAMVLVFAGFMFKRFKVTQRQKTIIEEKEHETQKQNEIITEQKTLVEEKQKEILDSIHYAKRIQTALITSEIYIEKHLNKLQKGI